MLAATRKNTESLSVLVVRHDSQLLTCFFLFPLFFKGWYTGTEEGELFPNTNTGTQVLIPNLQGHSHENNSNIASDFNGLCINLTINWRFIPYLILY